MSTTPNENQFAQINPYSAPKSQASLSVSKVLTTAIIVLVVAGFATAGALAYWRYTKEDVTSSAIVEKEEIFFRSPVERTEVQEVPVQIGRDSQP